MRLIFVPLYDDVLLEKKWLLAKIVNGDKVNINTPEEYVYLDYWMAYANNTLTIYTKSTNIKLIEGNEYTNEEMNKIVSLFNRASINLLKIYSKIRRERREWENQSPLIMTT